VYFVADAGVLTVRATSERELGHSTAKLAAHAARAEPARQAAIATATGAHRRWEAAK
jgi:hypothetical protein